ncbi:hypothetical protein NPIL_165551 [Nephila pilipes]|uniref:Uncharacterized protein n=1 Tax=Nephila pilipes TaxID=299642 RepID=A0A8X6PEL5_NEPPI|nr:hypothetical protein NPIL_165551 [Nephila pilipes]
MIHEKYDKIFPAKTLSPKQHYELCQELIEKVAYLEPEDVRINFIALCVTISLVTALSCLYGVIEAPNISHRLILRYLAKLTHLGVITNTFWEELQSICRQWIKEDE